MLVCFRVSPVNQTVPANTTAIFFCSSYFTFPDDISWSVYLPDLGKYYVEHALPHGSILSKRGFTFYTDSDSKYMNVSASEVNNGSNFRCREYDTSQSMSVFSDPAYLTVVGE